MVGLDEDIEPFGLERFSRRRDRDIAALTSGLGREFDLLSSAG